MTTPIRCQRLLARMSGGKRLIRQFDFNHDAIYFLEPGGTPVGSWTANEAIERGLLTPANDGLFPGTDQSWSLPQ